MSTYDFTWEVTDYDTNTGICTVVYSTKDKKLDDITMTIKITNADEMESIITASAPVHDWHRVKTKLDANTIIGLKGSGSSEV